MLLSNPSYFYFLVLTFLLFHGLRHGAPRRRLMLAASYFFYFQLTGLYLAVLLLVTVITYYGALRLRALAKEGFQSIYFVDLLLAAMLPLLFFKYLLPFLLDAIVADADWIFFPIGISFFTFAALGYLIDVYLELIEPERSFERLALFLAFFPVVSAGPIERAGRLLPQFEFNRRFSADEAFSALQLILVGLVVKLCIATRILFNANSVFTVPRNYPPLSQLTGVIFYAFELYADFLGYSLIAIGSARLFGIKVQPNFQQPFFSASVPEFWRRWHMSLSFWVRDYLFGPLRTEWRHRGRLGLAMALIVTMGVLGLWHGAKWGYVVFGLLHGVYLAASALTQARREAFWRTLGIPAAWLQVPRIIITFILVLIGFVVFRANTLADALTLYQGIFSLELFRNIGQALQFACFHQGQPLDYRLANLTGDWIHVAVFVAGDVLVLNGISLETIPRPARAVLCAVGAVLVVEAWIDFNVAAPFQYYKF